VAAVLTLENVTKSYAIRDEQLPILKGISLEIQQGDFTAIMGPSGSGKSTLLHLMGGLDRPTSGHISIAGKRVSDYDDRTLAKLRNETIGFVFQIFFLLNYYNALENVCLPLIYAGKFRRDLHVAVQLLEHVGLGHRMDHRPSEMSGGEKQRVAIARALVNGPAIVFADEPTGNLDSKTGEAIMDLLEEINRQGTTLILITHDPHIARRARGVIHIEDGQLR